MQIVRLPGEVPAGLRGGVVAIGNFDGVHRGHLAVLSQARAQAAAWGAPLLAMTFEPHPREYFQLELAPWGLFPLAERLRLLEEAGVQGVLLQRFDADFAAMPAEDFARTLLARTIGARLVVTGADFVFGWKRQGNATLLQSWLAEEEVDYAPCMAATEGCAPISSTRIRQALAEGAMGLAGHLLGRPYTTRGLVAHGRKLGRTLGYPTANIALTPRRAPRHGIYIAWGRVEQEAWWPAIISFGTRPMFDDGPPLVEAHRLDLARKDGEALETGEKYSIYGQELELAWGPYLRPEAKFDGLPDLVVQMDADAEAARLFHARQSNPAAWLQQMISEEIRT